jgi:hypothetical protein
MFEIFVLLSAIQCFSYPSYACGAFGACAFYHVSHRALSVLFSMSTDPWSTKKRLSGVQIVFCCSENYLYFCNMFSHVLFDLLFALRVVEPCGIPIPIPITGWIIFNLAPILFFVALRILEIYIKGSLLYIILKMLWKKTPNIC